MKASMNMRPVQKICEYGPAGDLLLPLMNIEKDEIDFKKIDYPELSDELKTAMSWIFHLFCDCAPDSETWGYVDPFSNLQKIDFDLKVRIIQAIGERYRIAIPEIKRNDTLINSAKVVGILFDDPEFVRIFKIHENFGEINWGNIQYGGLSGGYQVAVSWIYSILNSKLPDEQGFRNPICNFGVMDNHNQAIVLRAFALSIGTEIT
jgi:hypothetical protein